MVYSFLFSFYWIVTSCHSLLENFYYDVVSKTLNNSFLRTFLAPTCKNPEQTRSHLYFNLSKQQQI